MSSPPKLDAAGRRRSPATMPGYFAGRPPRSKGLRYPADPPRVEEIIAVMRAAGEGAHGDRVRGLIVVLWRAGLRIQEALALTESDLDERRGASDWTANGEPHARRPDRAAACGPRLLRERVSLAIPDRPAARAVLSVRPGVGLCRAPDPD